MSRSVEDLWWEGTTLVMKCEGQVWRFTEARFTSVDYGRIDCDTIQITPVEFVEIKLDE